MKKFISLLLMVCLLGTSIGMFGCGGSDSSGKTVLEISFHGDSIGGTWFDETISAFEKKYEDKVYAEGKQGVDVVKGNYSASLSNMETDAFAIYFRNRDSAVETFVRDGKLLDITDFVQEKYDVRDGETISIADKMNPSSVGTYTVNGSYYALPDAEFYACVTYDKDLFDEKGLYLGTSGTSYFSTICKQTYYFTNVEENKTCGPDGEKGTSDDGLPSSLFELAGLCEYMKKQKSVSPFAMAYNSQINEYANFLFDALMASLQGSQAKTMNSLESDGFEIITGWTNENLFPGVNTIKKPITRVIPITEETGYYTTWSADKYYAEAFVQLIIENQWWAEDTNSKNSSHTQAQDNFVFSNSNGDEAIGMLVEATYWYNEAANRDLFKNFFLGNPDRVERNICLMSLPTSLSTRVEEGKGEEPTYLCASRSFVCVNANIKDKPGLVEAVKDFLQFIYSDEQLSYCTAKQGLPRNLNYSIMDKHQNDFNAYGKSVWDLFSNANVVRFEGNTETFKNSTSLFVRGFEDGAFASSGYRSCFEPMMSNGKTAKEVFEDAIQMYSKDGWESIYKGSKTVGAYDNIVYAK